MIYKPVERIYLSPPHQSGLEMKIVEEVLASNWLSSVGPHLERFENEIEELFGYEKVLAVQSGTAALQLILRYIGVGKGDKVMVSNLTFIGGVSPVIYAGAEPVFIDNETDNWNLSPVLLEEYLESNVNSLPKALVLVHLYGIPADVLSIQRICNEYGVLLIEDCAEALGAKVSGKYVGSFGDFAFLSFNGNKTITTTGGGAVLTKDQKSFDRFLYLASQAKSDKPYYHHEELGYNYRMSNLLAGVGLAQLSDFKSRILTKQRIYHFYKTHLSGSHFKFFPEQENNFSTHWLTCALVLQKEPQNIIDALDTDYNVEARRIWNPMSEQPVFSEFDVVTNGASLDLFKKGICFPSGVGLTENDLHYIVNAINEIISR